MSETLKPTCALTRMFELQDAFNRRCGLDAKELNSDSTPFAARVRENWMNQLCTAISQEVSELRDCFPWKWWKKTPTDLQNARVEVVDLFHFVISAAQVLDMTPQDLLLAYEKKNQINHQRQDSGEATQVVARNPDDCRSI